MIELRIQIYEIGPGTVGMQIDKHPNKEKPVTPGERGFCKVIEEMLTRGPQEVPGIKRLAVIDNSKPMGN